MNNNSSTFTWILDTQYPPLNNGNPTNNTLVDSNNTTNTHPMYDGTETEEDLFNFLLQDPEKPSNKANSSSESISSGEEGYKPFTKTPDIAYSTGRLDFRQIYDNVSESQLKAMTSKERRQLRNKISARNFRNRRKGRKNKNKNKKKRKKEREKTKLFFFRICGYTRSRIRSTKGRK